MPSILNMLFDTGYYAPINVKPGGDLITVAFPTLENLTNSLGHRVKTNKGELGPFLSTGWGF